MVIGRLAPSPTGAQHLGNARTYLLAWLASRSARGRVVLRIEDIDSPRVKPWATAQAMEDLQWLGLDWDEGPDLGGPHAPYVQTARLSFYNVALERLLRDDRIYPCTCTRSDIEQASSAPHLGHEGPIYPGTCAAWRCGDSLPMEGTYCWRFRSTTQGISFRDEVSGMQTVVPPIDLGDFPVTRKDGGAAYQLAVVVDDAHMGVTQVVRGDDLLPSTFRQLQIYGALDLTPPSFAHVPLVLGEDGRRLAKRHGDTRLSWFRQQGIRASQIIGWAAASAGLCQAGAECMPAELVDLFTWDKLPRDPVRLASNNGPF